MTGTTSNQKQSNELRNANERDRVRQLNNAFGELNNLVPRMDFRNRQKTKLETLKAAIEYINLLHAKRDQQMRQDAWGTPNATGYARLEDHHKMLKDDRRYESHF